MTTAGLKHYQAVDSHGLMDGASAHRVAQIMIDTLLTRVAEAKGHVQRSEVAEKGTKIAKAIALVEGLIMSLDLERGGDIAANLQLLYEYIARDLVRANLEDSIEALDEVAELIGLIKSGWDGIEGAVAN